jgi:hypothetical protein
MKRKKHKSSLQVNQVNQVKIAFTSKPITSWGGISSLIAKFLEGINFRQWVSDPGELQQQRGYLRQGVGFIFNGFSWG